MKESRRARQQMYLIDMNQVETPGIIKLQSLLQEPDFMFPVSVVCGSSFYAFSFNIL